MNSFQNEELRALHRKRYNLIGLVFSSGDWNRAKHLLNPSVSPCLRRAPCLRRRLWGWREAGPASPCWGYCPHELLERKTEAFIGGIWYTVARDLMTYDTTGKRIRTENLAGQATTTAWDCCHKVSETRPDGSVTTWDYADGKGPKYDYDVHGQLAKRTWARGIDTFYSYDGWGNLTNTTYSDTTPTIALSYDAMGRQIEARDAAGVTTFAYDVFGANTNETVVGVAGTNILERFHDTFGRDAGYALNGVRQSTLGYDLATGRISSMAVPAEQSNNRTIEQFTWSYLPGSDLKSSLAYPNGLTASWTYGNRGELLGVDNALPSGSVSRFVYTYDAAGRRVGVEKSGAAFDQSDSINYGYNTRSELTNAIATVDADYRYGYAFDDIGNRRSSLECGVQCAEYMANNLNQYTAVDDFTPTYDADGNETIVKTVTGIWQITYNGENRPVQWTQGDTVIPMSFDRMGRRVTKNDKRFVYDGYLQIADNSGNAYVWDVTEPIATRPLAWLHSTSVAHYTHDGNKNVSEVVASNNNIIAHYEYAPFGALTVQRGESAMSNPWRFSSEYAEDETTTVYYNYRHYNIQLGVWLSRDPAYDLLLVRGGAKIVKFLFEIGRQDVEPFGSLEKHSYTFLSNYSSSSYDRTGLAGGGPWHPPEGVHVSCTRADNCSSLIAKMTLLNKMIHSHVGWDCLAPVGRGGGRHASEIASLYNAFAKCGTIWYYKGCPGFPPTLDPYPKKKCKSTDICQNGECKRVLYAAGLTSGACLAAYGVYKFVRTCAAGAALGPVGVCVSAALP